MARSDMTSRHGPGAAPRSRRDWFPPRAWLGALLALAAAVPAMAEPFTPDNDATVLERLPTAKDPRLAELRRVHAALARQPNNLTLAVKIAHGDVAEARARFDPRFNGYAQAALSPWWDLPAPPAPVRLVRALVRQSNHEFPAALADLDALIDADPAHQQALLTRAVVHQVRAEYELAARDCASVGQTGATLAASICADGVRGLSPDSDAAFRDLSQTYATSGGTMPPAFRVWALTTLAEMAARRGDFVLAERHFVAALATDPHDGYLLGAYADLLLDRDRPREVIDLLADLTRIDPLLLRLAIAERRLGLPAAPGHIADLADRFAASTARGETVHRREQARFTLELLDQPAAALDLAVANWQVQREPADARVLLECAAASGRPDAARPALDWLAATRLPDPALQHLAATLAASAAPGP